jgi:hypothetical protein
MSIRRTYYTTKHYLKYLFVKNYRNLCKARRKAFQETSKEIWDDAWFETLWGNPTPEEEAHMLEYGLKVVEKDRHWIFIDPETGLPLKDVISTDNSGKLL